MLVKGELFLGNIESCSTGTKSDQHVESDFQFQGAHKRIRIGLDLVVIKSLTYKGAPYSGCCICPSKGRGRSGAERGTSSLSIWLSLPPFILGA
ncbi:hypothetical protein D3C81_571310 [compost metagenome]